MKSYFEKFLSKAPSDVKYYGRPPSTESLAELNGLAIDAANRIARFVPELEDHPIFQRKEFQSTEPPRSGVSPLGSAALAIVSVGAILGFTRGFRRGDRGLSLAKSTMLGASVVGLLKGDS